MGEPSRRVEMVRLPREEEVFEVEAVLGRGADSVFPTEAAKAAADGRAAIVEALGARKFISESELETIKSTRGGTVDDGSVAADKPLAQILAERKAEKDAAFQETWRQMKTGKNRPLDPEEADFLDEVRRAEVERAARAAAEERSELEAFRAAVAAAAAGGGGGGGGNSTAAPDAAAVGGEGVAGGSGGGGGGTAAAPPPAERQGSLGAAAVGPAALKPAPAAAVPAIKPLIKVVRKGKRAAGGGENGNGSKGPHHQQQQQQQAERDEKRQRTGASGKSSDDADSDSGSGGGLAGLLGGYGSDSDDGGDS